MKVVILSALTLLGPWALGLGPRVPLSTQVGQAQAAREKEESRQHYRSGNDALHSEKYEVAEREFQMSIKLDPTFELARYWLGQTYVAMKRYPAAIAAFQECRDVFHANAAADSGDDLKRQRRVDDAIKDLQDQKRMYQSGGHGGPSAAPAVHQYIQEIDSQLSTLTQERQRKTTPDDLPTPAWLSLALGSAFFRTEAYADAEREYRAAIDVNPKLGEAHNNLAVVYLLTDRATQASTELDAAEKTGFKVNPQLKEDVKKALKKN